jgi:hypothetical protein
MNYEHPGRAHPSRSSLFVSRLPQETGSVAADDFRLERDPRLDVGFQAGHLSCKVSGDGYWSGSLAVDASARPPTTTHDVARELFEANPAYTAAPDHTLILVYSRWLIELAGQTRDEAMESMDAMVYHANYAWVSFTTGLGPFYMRNIGALLERNSEVFTQVHGILPFAPGSEEIVELVKAIQTFGFLPLHHGVGIAAPGLPTLLRTGGSGEYVQHPVFGRIPGGLRYLDLTGWAGAADTTFADGDLGTT